MPENYCAVNGSIIEINTTPIAPTDRSFALGDGLFETIKVSDSKAVWLSEHIARLKQSATYADIHFENTGGIENQCDRLIEKNKITDGFIRITLSRGTSPTGRFYDHPAGSTLVIICGEHNDPGLPLKAAFAEWSVNESDPAIRHKTTSRFSAVIAAQSAKKRGLDEIIFTNTKGELTEGITSNIFWVKKKKLYTPAPECGLLEGITRAKVIDNAIRNGMELAEGRYQRDELLEADEIFFTNSVMGVRQCNEIEGKMFNDCETVNRLDVFGTGGTK